MGAVRRGSNLKSFFVRVNSTRILSNMLLCPGWFSDYLAVVFYGDKTFAGVIP